MVDNKDGGRTEDAAGSRGSGEGIEVPPDRISDVVLRGIIESFVLEEGTDYGHRDYSLEEKVETVRKQLAARSLILVFDPSEGTCSIRRKTP